MSLINQMLRDLEHRNPLVNAPTQPSPPLQTLRYQPPQKRPGAAWLALGLIPLAWLVLRNNQPSVPSEPAKSAPVSVRTAEFPQQHPVAEQPLSIKQPEVETTVSTVRVPSEHTIIVAKPQPVPASPPVKPRSKTLGKASIQLTHNQSKVGKNNRVQTPNRPADQQAEALYKKAQANASRMMRKENLLEALELNPRHLPARHLLLQTLLQENAPIELKPFLDDSLALFPGNPEFVRALAHWQIKQKNFNAATTALEQLDAGNPNDPQHLALQAARYQQQQNFSQALPLYEKLTLIQPEKAENWLGLALCTDHLQQPGRAIQAYRRALHKNTLHNEVVDYINQRLSALTP